MGIAVVLTRAIDAKVPAKAVDPRLKPAPLRRFDFTLSIHILPKQGCAISRCLKPNRQRIPFQGSEFLPAPAWGLIAYDSMVMRRLPGQERCSAGSAKRHIHETVSESDALLRQKRKHLGHMAYRAGAVLIVCKNHDDVGTRNRGA